MGVKTDTWAGTGAQHISTSGGTITLTESSRGIVVGVAGSFACLLASAPNSVVFFPLLSAGVVHPLQVTHIYGVNSGTAANSIVAIY